MDRPSMPTWMASALLLLLLGGCATRPVNPPITSTDLQTGYRFETRQPDVKDNGKPGHPRVLGRRHARGGVFVRRLEFLQRTEIVGPKGNKVRLLDAVDVITGVSGGSFTALAYGLYGEKLFADYEQRFLKRNVQGEIIARTFSPRTGAAWRGRLGTFRTGVPAVRRNPVQRRDVRRPGPWQGTDDPGVGHRHLDRLPLCLQSKHLRRDLLGPECDAAFARRGSIVGGAGRTLLDHTQ